ncbi:hypothetical protein [Spiroplasma clarkii]|uniref:hypothetical protein n=1 Tax=Spiroplasma clarkii TaxID=2139 RepID=UPI0011BAD803|nr:hypothetical protein [Spiroplasma clarkii]
MDYKTSPFVDKIIEIKTSKHIPDEVINDNLMIIEEFLQNHIKCTPGPMSDCQQLIAGEEERLAYENGYIYIRFNHCAHWLHDNKYYLLTRNFYMQIITF